MLSCFRTVHDCDRWTHVLLRRALKLSSESAMALFCQALVETDQQHVARLLGYEGLHTFVIVFITHLHHQSGRGLGQLTQFLNFGTPQSISPQRMKLRSSNLMWRLGGGSSWPRITKWPQVGVAGVT